MSIINYISWYMTLNSSSFFESTIQSLDKRRLLSIFNKPSITKITNYCYIDKIDDKVVVKESDNFTNIPYQTCLFIGPNITLDNITLDNINITIPKCMTIFYMSSPKYPKEEILERWFIKLGLYPGEEDYFLLNEEISKEILVMIFNRSEIIINYTKKEIVSFFNTMGIYSCLLVIFLCMTSLLFLICGAYSSVNPIVTEVELERFKVLKYKDLKDIKEESCLICFEEYEDEDDLRILFCNHYFHKKCVDKWLCEQSSRCPYCRYTNKYYDEI